MTEERRNGYGDLHADVKVLKAQHADLKTDVGELKTDMKSVLAQMNQAQGGWKLLLAVGAVAGAVGALIGKFVPFMAK